MDGYPVEILAFEKGQTEGEPVAMLTVRHRPEFASAVVLLFDKEQCVRMRDSLDEFLNDEQSWLYIPLEEQQALRVEE